METNKQKIINKIYVQISHQNNNATTDLLVLNHFY